MIREKTKITFLDGLLLLLVIAVLIYIGYRVKIGLRYHWRWDHLPQFYLRFDKENNRWVVNYILLGLFTTVKLSILSTIVAIIIGAIGGIFRAGKSLFLQLVGRVYVELVRNTPTLVLIFIFYFFVSDQIMPVLGIDTFMNSCSQNVQNFLTVIFAPPVLINQFISAVFTVGFFEGAYITEIIRSGIQSIEKGQKDAAYALGLSQWHEIRFIILPQAIKRILPPLGGQFISTIKDSAIVSAISIQELTYQSVQLISTTYLIFETWITTTGLYLVLTLSLSLALARIEKRLRRSD